MCAGEYRFSRNKELESIEVGQLCLGRSLRYSLSPAAFSPLLRNLCSIVRLNQGSNPRTRADIALDAGNGQPLQGHDLTRNPIDSGRAIDKNSLVINDINDYCELSNVLSKID